MVKKYILSIALLIATLAMPVLAADDNTSNSGLIQGNGWEWYNNLPSGLKAAFDWVSGGVDFLVKWVIPISLAFILIEILLARKKENSDSESNKRNLLLDAGIVIVLFVVIRELAAAII